jgi:hypothetical protein
MVELIDAADTVPHKASAPAATTTQDRLRAISKNRAFGGTRNRPSIRAREEAGFFTHQLTSTAIRLLSSQQNAHPATFNKARRRRHDGAIRRDPASLHGRADSNRYLNRPDRAACDPPGEKKIARWVGTWFPEPLRSAMLLHIQCDSHCSCNLQPDERGPGSPGPGGVRTAAFFAPQDSAPSAE